jgi:hypothetical protein
MVATSRTGDATIEKMLVTLTDPKRGLQSRTPGSLLGNTRILRRQRGL